MPTLARGCCKPSLAARMPSSLNTRHRQLGFTLIELLVVLVIIGLVVGMVTVNLMPDSRAELRQEAERLALLLENASLDARSSGHTLAWSAEGGQYSFWRKGGNGEWQQIVDDSMLRPRQLPEPIQISRITVEEAPLNRGERLILSASALPLPYKVTLTNHVDNMQIEADSMGRVLLNQNSDQQP